MGDDFKDFDDSWVPFVSDIIGAIIGLVFFATLICFCCAGYALYKRRKNMQLTGVTTATHTGFGQNWWGRNERVIIVQQTQPPGHQHQQEPLPYEVHAAPPPYYPNPDYPAQCRDLAPSAPLDVYPPGPPPFHDYPRPLPGPAQAQSKPPYPVQAGSSQVYHFPGQ